MSVAECPRRGRNHANIAGSACVLPCSMHEQVVSTDEISPLEDEVRRLDEEIFRLNQDRATILRRINSMRSATRRLPPEILSTIFQFASPPFSFVPPFASDEYRHEVEPYCCDEIIQCNIATVSHVWRQAAISTPRLWTSVSLDIDLSFINATLSSLDLFAKYALSQPMSIELDFGDQATAWSDDREESLRLMEPIKEAVFADYADRIQSLRLIEPPTEWFPCLGSLSRCEALVITRPSQEGNPEHLNLTELPYLRHVVLVCPGRPFSLPRSTITTLHLFNVPSTICMELLISCPSLVEFEMYAPFCQSATTQIVNRPVTLEQVEYLTWSSLYCDCLPIIQRCIGYLRFSKLRALQWYGDNCCYPSSNGRDQRLDFFANLPITLSSLTFYRFIYTLPGSIHYKLLSSIPQLRELYLFDCNADCVESIINAIGRPVSLPENIQLRGVSSILPRPSNHKFLPNLSKLTLGRKIGLNTLDGRIFVDMLKALHNSGTNPKQFQLMINDAYASWNFDTLYQLRKLVALGFSVRIAGNSDFS